MTSALIRRLMACGYAPEKAQSICVVYIAGASLSVLEQKIEKVERGEQSVDKLQPEPSGAKCG